MRVLHILYSGIGGVFSVVDSLIKNSNFNTNGTLYIGPNLSKDTLKHKNILKKNFFFVKTKKFFTSLYFFNIIFRIYKFNPQIIVLHNYQIFPCTLVKIFLRKKLIYVDHKPLKLKNFKDFLIINFFQFFIDHFVVLNKENYNYIKKKIFNKNKISKIYNGIDLKYYKSKTKKKYKTLRVGMAARLNNTKSQDILINAIQSLIEKKIKVLCYLAGDGENINNLKKILMKNNKKKIIFSGALDQSELKRWYKKINLYIQASKGEGMSISIFQAMAMGIPVMGSDVTGINNLRHPSKSYNMIFKNNPKDLENKILNFFKSKSSTKNRIIKEQAKYLKNNFSNDLMNKKYEKLYKYL
jgi:glycosyltransferase involved in cell wall biosynthesis